MGVAEFLLSTLSGVLANRIDGSMRFLASRGFGTPKWFYYRELRSQLERMPFIYRDLELQVLQDAVGVQLERLQSDTLIPTHQTNQVNRSTFERLRDSRKVLLIGQAGIGKTTLFRYCILSQITAQMGQFKLPRKDRVIPFYVPLKAVDASAERPIVTYLLSKHSMFRGPGGAAKLRRLAARKKLMLFIDGYDEIPIVAGTERIRRELGKLFSRSVPAEFPYENVENFYHEFVGSRIWLSSRREFFLGNPIPLPDDVAVFWSHGVGGERIRLVAQIFSKYQEHSPDFYREKLDPERFLQQLAVAADGALLDLSYNPLFLTVMCFVYVGDIRDQRDPAEVLRQGSSKLLRRCIDLLLVDIDAAKVRGLSDAQRAALMHRRAAYEFEKRGYLQYLAAESYLANEPLLGEDALRGYAQEYFSRYSESANCADIIKGLSSNDATVNLVTQTIYSGVLVGVENDNGKPLYDFPHRRFKELLACGYLDNELGLNRLVENVNSPHLAELLIVYVQEVQQPARVLHAILDNLGKGDRSLRMSSLLYECLVRIDGLALREQVIEELLARISRDSREIQLTKRLLEFVPAFGANLRDLEEMLEKSILTRDDSMFSFVAPILGAVSRVTLVRKLDRLLSGGNARDEFGYHLSAFVVDNEPELISTLLKATWPEADTNVLDNASLQRLMETVYSRGASTGGRKISKEVVQYFNAHSEKEFEAMVTERLNALGSVDDHPPMVRTDVAKPLVWADVGPGTRWRDAERAIATKWKNLGFAKM
jgi:hypothetical protein